MKTQRRRRREARTDYKARFNLLKSDKPRLVVRKTNRYIIAQIIQSDVARDKVLITISSKDLLDKGWPKEKSGSLKSLQAAYLTGFLLGKKLKGKIKEAVFDTGLNRNISGSRIYAVLKGVVESGIDVIHNPECLPSEDRLKENKTLSNLIERIKEKL